MRQCVSWMLLLMVWTDQGKASWLDSNFQFRVDSYKVNYSLSRKGNYLRFNYLGKEQGFYLKPCHKRLIKSLNQAFDQVATNLLVTHKMKPGESLPNGRVTMNTQVFPYYREVGKQSDLYGLEEKLSMYFRMAEKECSQK